MSTLNINTRADRISLFWEIYKASQAVGNPYSTRSIAAWGVFWRTGAGLLLAVTVASFKWEIPGPSWVTLGLLVLSAAGVACWRYASLPHESTVERVDRLLLRYEPFDQAAFQALQQALIDQGPTLETFDHWLKLEREAIAKSGRQLDAKQMRFTERQL